ncbi:MAG: IclR family transcriptional regulator [Actinomycetota bacterium]|nr:IclR family transcriptional regulator [Actinomycetota bacterium]
MSKVQSIDRAFQILRELSEKAGGITDLSRRVGLPTSTVARLLSALEESDAIERVAGSYEYKLGPRILQMATQSNQSETLLAMARPHMVNLVEKLFENSGLSIPSGYEVQYVGQVNCANPVQIRDWTGTRLPMHVVPSGLVSLAHLPVETVERFLDRKLERYTTNTVTNKIEVLRRLEKIREEGFCWCIEEFSEGINSVAAPVFSKDGIVIGALHVHGPSYRFPDKTTKKIVSNLVLKQAKKMSRELGQK